MSSKVNKLKNKPDVKVDAREMLKREAAKAEQTCEMDINAALAKHKCSLEPTFMATAQGNTFNIRIVYRGFDQQ